MIVKDLGKDIVLVHGIDSHYLYHTEKMFFVPVSSDSEDDIQKSLDLCNKISDSVKSDHFRKMRLSPHPRYPKSIVLNVTHNCTNKCDYCFVDAYYGEMSSKIDFDIVKKYLDNYTDNAVEQSKCGSKRPSISIGFFGGEPCMAMDIVKSTVDYVKDKYENPRFGITTNAVLFSTKPSCLGNKYIYEYLIENMHSSIISLDGPKGAHDEHRRLKDGQSSTYELVVEALNNIKGSNLARSTTLRGTFTSDIVTSKYSLKDRLEFLNSKVYEGCANHVSLEPVNLTESNCISSDFSRFKESDIDHRVRSLYYEATNWYIEEAKQGRRPHWHNLDKFVERIFYRNFAISECGASGGYQGLNPKGDITACHHEQNTKIGHVDTGIDESLRAKWCDNRLYTRVGCLSCPIRWVCGSGCREFSISQFKDQMDENLAIKYPVKVQCKLNEIIFECALEVIRKIPEWVIQHIHNPRAKKIGNIKVLK